MYMYERTKEELLERDQLKMEALQSRFKLINTKIQEIQVMNIMKEVLSRRNQLKVLKELRKTIGPDIMFLGSINRIDRLIKTRSEIIEGIEALYEEIRMLDTDYTYFITTLTPDEKEKFLLFDSESKENYATSITNQRIQELTQTVTLEDMLSIRKKEKCKFSFKKN